MWLVTQGYPFGRQQDREQFPATIAPAALSLTNGTHGAQVLPDQLPLDEVVPHTELFGRSPQDLLARTAQPGHQRIISQDILFITHSKDADEDRTALKGRAETSLALAQSGLACPQLLFGSLSLGDIQC